MHDGTLQIGETFMSSEIVVVRLKDGTEIVTTRKTALTIDPGQSNPIIDIKDFDLKGFIPDSKVFPFPNIPMPSQDEIPIYPTAGDDFGAFPLVYKGEDFDLFPLVFKSSQTPLPLWEAVQDIMDNWGPVTEIISVSISEAQDAPNAIIIKATGQVNTGGWGAVQLKARQYVRVPEDGVQEFDLIAVAPTPGAITTSAFEPVKGSIYWSRMPWHKKYRVYGAGNSVEIDAGVFVDSGPWVIPRRSIN